MPIWYNLIRAAKYLGVAPWDLAERPAWWMQVALIAENTEAEAQEKRAEREKKSAAKKKG